MKYWLLTFPIIFALNVLSAQHSTVAPMVGNVLTKGIPNYIKIGLPGIAADSILVTARHSKIEKIDNWAWYITPDTAFKSETIVVTAFRKKKVVSVDSTVFRLKWAADPHAYILNSTGANDTLWRQSLLSAIGITARAWNAEEDARYTVVFFAMRIEPNPTVYLSNNQFLTPIMKGAINEAKSGDRVVFNNIRVKYPDGRIKVVEDISIVLR